MQLSPPNGIHKVPPMEPVKRRKHVGETVPPTKKRCSNDHHKQQEMRQGACKTNYVHATNQPDEVLEQSSSDIELEEEGWCKKDRNLASGPRPSTYLSRNTPPPIVQDLIDNAAKDRRVPGSLEQRDVTQQPGGVEMEDNTQLFFSSLGPNKHIGFLSHNDLDSLSGCNLLNDNVLAAFMGTEVATRNAEVCIFAAQFFDILVRHGVTTATKNQARNEQRVQKPIWIIPGNTMAGLHWVLVVVNFSKKIIACFDSLGPGITKTELKLLQTFMAASRRNTSMRWSEWSFFVSI